MDRQDPRPPIDARLLAPDGTVVTVMARWPGGVVFDNETAAKVEELGRYERLPSPALR